MCFYVTMCVCIYIYIYLYYILHRCVWTKQSSIWWKDSCSPASRSNQLTIHFEGIQIWWKFPHFQGLPVDHWRYQWYTWMLHQGPEVVATTPKKYWGARDAHKPIQSKTEPFGIRPSTFQVGCNFCMWSSPFCRSCASFQPHTVKGWRFQRFFVGCLGKCWPSDVTSCRCRTSQPPIRKMPKKELLTSHVAIMERLSEEFACTGGVAWWPKLLCMFSLVVLDFSWQVNVFFLSKFGCICSTMNVWFSI